MIQLLQNAGDDPLAVMRSLAEADADQANWIEDLASFAREHRVQFVWSSGKLGFDEIDSRTFEMPVSLLERPALVDLAGEVACALMRFEPHPPIFRQDPSTSRQQFIHDAKSATEQEFDRRGRRFGAILRKMRDVGLIKLGNVIYLRNSHVTSDLGLDFARTLGSLSRAEIATFEEFLSLQYDASISR